MKVVKIVDGVIQSWHTDKEADGINFFVCPDDYDFGKYLYVPLEDGGYNEDGFFVVNDNVVDFEKRLNNIQLMNNFMKSELTQSNLDLFLSDSAIHIQGYLNGGGRLITWIESTSRNGYNAKTNGFKLKLSYCGGSTNGILGEHGNYPRANTILEILNNL